MQLFYRHTQQGMPHIPQGMHHGPAARNPRHSFRTLDTARTILYNYTVKMNEHTKKERQHVLRDIIAGHEIGDQPHLLIELKKRGVEATQATISRDLQEMGVSKVRIKSGVYKYEVIEKVPTEVIWNKLKVLFDNFVVDIKSTGNLILVKTSPGNANGVGSYIDRLELLEILGTVAGDDTILVIVDTAENSRDIENDFQQLLEGGVLPQTNISK